MISITSSPKKRRAIITGGSQGIGKAIALGFKAEGIIPLVLDITEPDYEIEFRYCDVRDETTLAEIAAAEDAVDVLVNNAGVYIRASILETTQEQLDLIIDTNLKGSYLCSKHFIPRILSRKGNIINIASGLGIVPEPESPAYCAAKAGLIMLTKCLAQEYAAKGIRVNAVLPGPIDTPMLRAGLSSEVDLEAYRQTNPMKTIGSVEDVANVVLFLASDEARFVTGGLYSVDGGESTSSIYSK